MDPPSRGSWLAGGGLFQWVSLEISLAGSVSLFNVPTLHRPRFPHPESGGLREDQHWKALEEVVSTEHDSELPDTNHRQEPRSCPLPMLNPPGDNANYLPTVGEVSEPPCV